MGKSARRRLASAIWDLVAQGSGNQSHQVAETGRTAKDVNAQRRFRLGSCPRLARISL
jgi:hypothetical protein